MCALTDMYEDLAIGVSPTDWKFYWYRPRTELFTLKHKEGLGFETFPLLSPACPQHDTIHLI